MISDSIPARFFCKIRKVLVSLGLLIPRQWNLKTNTSTRKTLLVVLTFITFTEFKLNWLGTYRRTYSGTKFKFIQIDLTNLPLKSYQLNSRNNNLKHWLLKENCNARNLVQVRNSKCIFDEVVDYCLCVNKNKILSICAEKQVVNIIGKKWQTY